MSWIGKIFWLLLTAAVLLLLLYISRFWIWQAPWGNEGLFGIRELSPRGDVLRRLLRGTSLAPFDIVIWGLLAFGILSMLQSLKDKLSSSH